MDYCDSGASLFPQLYILVAAQIVACSFLVFHIFVPVRLKDVQVLEQRSGEVLALAEQILSSQSFAQSSMIASANRSRESINQLLESVKKQEKQVVVYTDAGVQTDTLVINADSAIINEYILLQRRYQQLFESQQKQVYMEHATTQVDYCDMLIQTNCEETQRLKLSSEHKPCQLANSYKSLRESMHQSQITTPFDQKYHCDATMRTGQQEVSFSNIGAPTNPLSIWRESRARTTSQDVQIDNVFESLIISEYLEDSEEK